jgi:hypothetical protein
MKRSKTAALALIGLFYCLQAMATPTDEEVAQLGKTLTPMGGEVAGNADGSIPRWDGGLCKPPAGYKPTHGDDGGGPYVDPFAGEKPLLSIDKGNLAQYADKLDEGSKALFARYPDSFRIDVYPTHRTACFPDWVYRNTSERAQNPQLVGNAPGLIKAQAQIPFPIPKSGYEAMWNQALRMDVPYSKSDQETWLVDAGGGLTLLSLNRIEQTKHYWNRDLAAVPDNKPHWTLISSTIAPASAVGVKSLRHNFLNTEKNDTMAWSYVPGQRRVRLAPENKYDTVSTSSGGILLFDEISGFDGKMDKFDFVLKGKREMFVPANAYAFNEAPAEKVGTPNHANPDYLRFELRRVWVVEGTLKPGERHVQKEKVFYLDEDSWSPMIYNAFDQADKLQKVTYFPGFQEYDKPLYRAAPYVLYDLTKRIYSLGTRIGGSNTTRGFYLARAFPPTFFSPNAMAGNGIR